MECEAAQRIRLKNPGRVPIICELHPSIMSIRGWQTRRKKFLVSEKLNIGQFRRFIEQNLIEERSDGNFCEKDTALPSTGKGSKKSRILNENNDRQTKSKNPKVALFLSDGPELADDAMGVLALEDKCRSPDGFLYIKYVIFFPDPQLICNEVSVPVGLEQEEIKQKTAELPKMPESEINCIIPYTKQEVGESSNRAEAHEPLMRNLRQGEGRGLQGAADDNGSNDKQEDHSAKAEEEIEKSRFSTEDIGRDVKQQDHSALAEEGIPSSQIAAEAESLPAELEGRSSPTEEQLQIFQAAKIFQSSQTGENSESSRIEEVNQISQTEEENRCLPDKQEAENFSSTETRYEKGEFSNSLNTTKVEDNIRATQTIQPAQIEEPLLLCKQDSCDLTSIENHSIECNKSLSLGSTRKASESLSQSTITETRNSDSATSSKSQLETIDVCDKKETLSSQKIPVDISDVSGIRSLSDSVGTEFKSAQISEPETLQLDINESGAIDNLMPVVGPVSIPQDSVVLHLTDIAAKAAPTTEAHAVHILEQPATAADMDALYKSSSFNSLNAPYHENSTEGPFSFDLRESSKQSILDNESPPVSQSSKNPFSPDFASSPVAANHRDSILFNGFDSMVLSDDGGSKVAEDTQSNSSEIESTSDWPTLLRESSNDDRAPVHQKASLNQTHGDKCDGSFVVSQMRKEENGENFDQSGLEECNDGMDEWVQLDDLIVAEFDGETDLSSINVPRSSLERGKAFILDKIGMLQELKLNQETIKSKTASLRTFAANIIHLETDSHEIRSGTDDSVQLIDSNDTPKDVTLENEVWTNVNHDDFEDKDEPFLGAAFL